MRNTQGRRNLYMGREKGKEERESNDFRLNSLRGEERKKKKGGNIGKSLVVRSKR